MHTYKPEQGTYHSYYDSYVQLTDDVPPVFLLERSLAQQLEFYRSIPEEQWNYRYAAGKWNIREILCHVTDTERIFAYRALAFSRGDQTSLPGFDENAYADGSGASDRSMDDLIEEYRAVRSASLALFRSFNTEQWKKTGTANGNISGTLPIAFIIAGHEMHHSRVIRERYLGQ